MKIWVDADSCPVVVREILFRAAARTAVQLTLVANQPVRFPKSPFISMLRVGAGLDVADKVIMKHISAGDLLITSDIPLAADAISVGGQVLSPRGELYTENNIRARLNVRDFLDTMRASGINTGGPPALNQADRKAFADHLDTILARSARDE